MSQPQTLLQLAGLSPTPAAMAESTLVMIDAQREYVDGSLPLTGVEEALQEGARLAAAAALDVEPRQLGTDDGLGLGVDLLVGQHGATPLRPSNRCDEDIRIGSSGGILSARAVIRRRDRRCRP